MAADRLNKREKKREEVREGDDLPVILISGKLSSIYPSRPPSLPHAVFPGQLMLPGAVGGTACPLFEEY